MPGLTPGPSQRGAASLVVLLLLLGASLLVAAWSQRHVITELHIAANQVRRIVAFEAAEAGLAWAQAMLDNGHVLGPDCRPGGAAGGASFRARYLAPPDATGRLQPRRRNVGNTSLPLQLACVRQGGAWACDCPGGAAPALAVSGDAAAPAFQVEFAATPGSGTVELIATGCSHPARPCLPGSADRADASMRLRVTLALLPVLATPPAATLTARGDIDAGSAALGLHNADARAGGLVAHAGGAIKGTALRIQTVPGAVAATATLAGDASLAASSASQLFMRHFGVGQELWPLLPGVVTVPCVDDCSTALLETIVSQGEPARIAVRGDLRLAGPLQIGSTERPVVLVVDGALTLSGPVQLHGLVHATRLQWDDLAAHEGGLLHGAVLLAEGYSGQGAPDLVYDPALVQRLQRQAGSWVRVPGSWRDF